MSKYVSEGWGQDVVAACWERDKDVAADKGEDVVRTVSEWSFCSTQFFTAELTPAVANKASELTGLCKVESLQCGNWCRAFSFVNCVYNILSLLIVCVTRVNTYEMFSLPSLKHKSKYFCSAIETNQMIIALKGKWSLHVISRLVFLFFDFWVKRRIYSHLSQNMPDIALWNKNIHVWLIWLILYCDKGCTRANIAVFLSIKVMWPQTVVLVLMNSCGFCTALR